MLPGNLQPELTAKELDQKRLVQIVILT